MNFIDRLRQHLTWRAAHSTAKPERPQPTEQERDTGTARVAFDQVERLSGSGASLETLLEMNRVQGW